MAKSRREPKIWRFSEARKNSLRKAQRTHAYLVDLGKRARAKGMK